MFRLLTRGKFYQVYFTILIFSLIVSPKSLGTRFSSIYTKLSTKSGRNSRKKNPSIYLFSEFWLYDILIPSHIVGQIALVHSSCGFSSHFSPLFFSLPLIAPPTANTTDTIHKAH